MVSVKFIQGIKNVAADVLSRNDLIFKLTKKVSTEKFEELVHEVHSIDMTVPVDYKVISQLQADDNELKEFQSSKDTTRNYKIIDFGRTLLWTKKGQDGQDKIWLPSSLRKILLEGYHAQSSPYLNLLKRFMVIILQPCLCSWNLIK